MSQDRPKRTDGPEGSNDASDGEHDPSEHDETASHVDGVETDDSEDTAPQTEHSESEVPIDDVFELLAQPGNRYILTYLLRTDAGEVTYSELVEHVLETAETPSSQDEADFRGRIAARLVHSNLPKLEEAGLVAVDTDAQVVSATGRIDIVVPYLELAMEQSLDAEQ